MNDPAPPFARTQPPTKGSQHEAPPDRCGGGRRTRILGACLGATGQSVGRQFHGRAGSKSWRPGADAVQLGSAHDGSSAAFGTASGDGSLGDAAVFDVRHQFGNAAEAPGIPPCLPRQDGRASSRERSAIDRKYRQPAEPRRTRPLAGGKYVDAGGPSFRAGDGFAVKLGGYQRAGCSAV